MLPRHTGGRQVSFLSEPLLNNEGQAAFRGFLTGPGEDNNTAGIWAENLQGVLTLIARGGDLLDADDGPGTDFRTINNLSLSSASDAYGPVNGFNDLGQLAFTASFTDGTSGVFVSNLVAVPEPACWVLMVVGVLGLGASRRRW